MVQTLRVVGPTFEEFAAARTGALLRYAHVLTGDRARAEDLVQDGLAGVYKHWSRVGERNPEGYVRRSILHGYLGRWRRIGRWEQPAATLYEHPTPDPTEAVVERAAMKQDHLCCLLPAACCVRSSAHRLHELTAHAAARPRAALDLVPNAPTIRQHVKIDCRVMILVWRPVFARFGEGSLGAALAIC